MSWMIGVLGFDSQRWLGIFPITASRTALGPNQPPIQWVPGALSLGIKRPRCEADHSPPSSAEVKERVELYLHQHSFMAWCSTKAQGQLYLLPLPWTGDRPDARPLPIQESTIQKTRTHIHASSGIRTHGPDVRAVEGSTCLRPRGH
jgi:hypothetical protein